MTPNVFYLLFLLMADMSLSAPTKTENPVNETDNSLEVIPRPKIDFESYIFQGDILVPKTTNKNADPCVVKGCLWPKHGRHVNVPYVISPYYTQEERNIIVTALWSLQRTTCIRFVQHSYNTRDFIYFIPLDGCRSNMGRQVGGQYISLARPGCLSHRTVQHEVLHALGFNHEQVRSDRDAHVKILFENIEEGKDNQFRKVETNNLGTPYDFKSVMQYGKYAFSKNGLPTIVAQFNPNYDWGRATQMSANDIARVNRLYQCSES
ncbi:low choriolytic enzyme-like isoform X1 [Xiphophorus maculatus]|uniref:low choriolytic enzyme-like isoform X1 n=1 Tax=Xiphophorus maculatus TaxID=8083 RepID=UPI000C6E46B5|nr:low choriolytic enzyme-like isoform X1 [Xiphophorus maculatus]